MSDDDATVLIVEDEERLADLFRRWLDDRYAVRVAGDLAEGRAQLDETVDVVLLDRRLPSARGDDLLETIADRELTPAVAMVTAVDPDFDLASKPIDTYVVKPVDRETVRELVAELLERRDHAATLQELLALISRRVTIEAEKTTHELDSSEEYQELCDRIDRLTTDLSEQVADLNPDEIQSVLRSVDLSMGDLEYLLERQGDVSNSNC
jgi:DNA-binding response OmpR family regulator